VLRVIREEAFKVMPLSDEQTIQRARYEGHGQTNA